LSYRREDGDSVFPPMLVTAYQATQTITVKITIRAEFRVVRAPDNEDMEAFVTNKFRF
jgi:hypothetical protein